MSITIQEFVTKQNTLNNKRRFVDGPDISWEDTGAGFRPHIFNLPTQSSGDTYDGYFKVTKTPTEESPYKLTVSFGRVQVNNTQFEIAETDVILAAADIPAEEESEGYLATFIYIDFDYNWSTGVASNPTIEYTASDGAFPQDDADTIMILLAIAKWTPASGEVAASISSIIQQNYGMIYRETEKAIYTGEFAVVKTGATDVSVVAGTAVAGLTNVSVTTQALSITSSKYVYLTVTYSGSYTSVITSGASVPAQTSTTYSVPLAYVTVETVDEELLITTISQMQFGRIFIAGRFV